MHAEGGLWDVVRLASERCLGTQFREEQVSGLLERLGKAAGASAVRLLQHTGGEGGERQAGVRHTWPAGLPAASPAWRGTGFQRWADLLDGGVAVHGPAGSFPQPERDALELHQVAAVGVVPVPSGNVVWGALHFEGLARPWTKPELDAVETFARILGAAIEAARAAQAARRREACLAAIAEASPLGIYLVDARDGAVIYLNRCFGRQWGLEEAPRQHDETVRQCLPKAKDRAALAALLDLSSSDTSPLETELDLEDGRLVRCLSRVIHDQDGACLGHLLLVEDITGWRQAEDALRLAHNLFESRVRERTAELAEANRTVREREELYRRLVETSPDCICLTDSRYQVAMSNRQSVSLFGLSTPGDAVGMRLADFVAGRDPEEFIESAARRLREEGDVHNLELELRRLDGSTFPAEVSASVIEGEGGAPSVLAVIRDISGRRRAEQALHTSERRLRAIFEEAPLGIGVINRHGCITESNHRLDHLLGFNAGALPGTDLHSLLHPADLGSIWSGFEEVVTARRERYLTDTRVLDQQGRWVWVRLAISAICASPGAEFVGIALIQDITEQKALEEHVRQSTKMEAIGRLAGGIAHDFNNLLTVIKGYSDLLLRDARPEEQVHRRASQIRKASQRAGALVEKLLAFSRKQVVEPRLLRLNAAVADLEGMLRRLVGEGIKLITRTDPQAGWVEMDPVQLEQIIMNLVVNARDAMPRGGMLTITTQAADSAEAPGVTISVSDTGVGMSEEIRSHIFEPFFTTKEVGKGTGLGLATVYGVVQQAGGRITVTSEPGWGTAFDVWLPAAGAPEEAVEADQGAVAPGARGTVLVCEDEEMVRSMIVDALREEGYRVIETEDGREAVRRASEEPGAIDLLLTDMVMPNMGGRELAETLADARRASRVLYMSGHTEENLGTAAHFLKKPFTPEVLLEKVRRVLDDSKD